MRSSLCIYLCAAVLWLPMAPAWAENNTTDIVAGQAKSSEYVAGNYPRSVLISVSLWGAVPKTGIHHIPRNTSLDRLLSLAGGPSLKADLSDVRIKRVEGGRYRLLSVNVERIFHEASATTPTLEPNDVILVPATKPVVSDNVARTLSLMASVLGIVLTSIVLADQL